MIFGLGVSLGALVTTATPVAAHTALESSSPGDGARIGVAPDQITLEFTGPIRTRLSKLSVRGPGGERFELGSPQATSDTVTQLLRPLGAAGKYQIVFRVVARDGHPLTGTIEFTLTRPGPAVSAPPANTPGGAEETTVRAATTQPEEVDETPAWLLAIGAAGTVSAVTGALWFGRRVTRDLD
jgi:methionine-rich copper-binding protein CopC